MRSDAIESRRLFVTAMLANVALAGACAASGANGDDPPAIVDAGGGAHRDGASSPDASAPSDDAATTTDGGATADAAADGPSQLPPMTMPAFIVGYNEAWFGAGFGTGLTTTFDRAYVDATFDGIVRGGGHVVRIFLFELAQGIALGTTPPQTQGVSPAMLANVASVLESARARGLWVYVTALEGNAAYKYPPQQAYFKNLFNDTSGEGQAFQSNVLAPLLAVLDAHKDNVFGLDLVNEIDAPRSNGVWADPTNGSRAFIQRTASFVKSRSPWLRVTTTVGWGGAQYDVANGYLSGLGLDFYDFHIYSDSGTYGGATAVCNRAAADGVPVYLGEFGQASHMIDDTLQYNATASFLNTAKSLCFKGALAWRYDTAENWWSYVRADGGYRPAVAIMQAFGGP